MKKRLFIDCDSTIWDSIKAMIKTYAVLDRDVDLTKPLPTTCKEWNATDVFPNVKRNVIDSVFTSELFFDIVEPFDNAIEVLKSINDMDIEIFIVSSGDWKNLVQKKKWFDEHIPFVKFIPIEKTDDNVSDKSIVNMAGSMFIDDRTDCLASSNAEYKVLYINNGVKTEWSYDDGVNVDHVSTNWIDIFREVIKFYNINIRVKETMQCLKQMKN